MRDKRSSQLASTQAPVRPPASNPYVGASVPPNPAWSSASVAPNPAYPGGPFPMAMAAAAPRIPPPAQNLQSPFATTPPPAMHWEYKFDPTSQRPYDLQNPTLHFAPFLFCHTCTGTISTRRRTSPFGTRLRVPLLSAGPPLLLQV